MSNRRRRRVGDDDYEESCYGGPARSVSAKSAYSANSSSKKSSTYSYGGIAEDYEDEISSIDWGDRKETSGPVGTIKCEWMKLIGERPPEKSGKQKYQRPTPTLPVHVIPSIRWESVPHGRTGNAPVGRQGHGVAAVASSASTDRSVTAETELFYVVGGGREMPIQVPLAQTDGQTQRPNVTTEQKAGSRPTSSSTVSTQASSTVQRATSARPSSGTASVRCLSPWTDSRPNSRLDCRPEQGIDGQWMQIPGAQVLRRRSDAGPTAFRFSSTPGPPEDKPISPPAPRAGTTGKTRPKTPDLATPRRQAPSDVRGGRSQKDISAKAPSSSTSPPPRTAAAKEKAAALEASRVMETPKTKAPTKSQVDWHTPSVELPRHLASCSVTSVSGGKRIVVFGGLDYEYDEPVPSRSLRVLEVAQGIWRDETEATGGPVACFEHAAAVAAGGRDVLVHGGRTSLYENEGYMLSLTYSLQIAERSVRWAVVEPRAVKKIAEKRRDSSWSDSLVIPHARRAHTMVSQGGLAARSYIFGGVDAFGQVSAGLLVLDYSLNFWLTVDAAGTAPPARAYHSASLLSNYMIVFGGIGTTGAAMKDLRLLHCPSLIWFTPKFSETLYEPCARAAHAAVATIVESRPGTETLLIFGGRGASGESLNDVYRLVLSFPQQRTDDRWNTDAAFRYCADELHIHIVRLFIDFITQMENIKEGHKDHIQEARDLDTLALGARAKCTKFEGLFDAAHDREQSVLAELAAEEEALADSREDAKNRKREIDIEHSSYRARIQRLAQRVDCHLALGNRPDVELVAAAQPLTNPFCPTSCVDRFHALWNGASVCAEVVHRTSGPSGRSRSAAAAPSAHPRASRPGSASPARATVGRPFSARLRALRQKIDADTGSGDDDEDGWSEWEHAVRNELRIVTFLRHPNLQEVYGAIFDSAGVILINGPSPLTLASLYSRAKAPSDGVVSADQPLSENERLHVSCDLASALDYLHSQGVTHRHVVAENVLLSRGFCTSAKLAGHFASRVTCRVASKPLVLGKGSGVPADMLSLAGVSMQSDINLVDARPADIICLGWVLLTLWQESWHSIQSAASSPKNSCAKNYRGSKISVGDTVDRLETLSGAFGADIPAALARIRDATVRLVVRTCLSCDGVAALPSARALHCALCELQKGDFAKIPDGPQFDPSRESKLVDITAEQES